MLRHLTHSISIAMRLSARYAARYVGRLILLGAVSALATIAIPAPAIAQGVTGVMKPPVAPTPSEPRISVAPVLSSRSPALQDAGYAVKAMRLTTLQEQALAQVRARYAPSIKAYVARLNALDQRSVAADTLKATEDTLKAILVAEHTAADSLITPDQKQRYLNALRQVHAASVINPVSVKRASPRTTTLVPIPQSSKSKGKVP